MKTTTRLCLLQKIDTNAYSEVKDNTNTNRGKGKQGTETHLKKAQVLWLISPTSKGRNMKGGKKLKGVGKGWGWGNDNTLLQANIYQNDPRVCFFLNEFIQEACIHHVP